MCAETRGREPLFATSVPVWQRLFWTVFTGGFGLFVELVYLLLCVRPDVVWLFCDEYLVRLTFFCILYSFLEVALYFRVGFSCFVNKCCLLLRPCLSW